VSYSDEWLNAVAAARQHTTDAGSRFARETRAEHRPTQPRTVAPAAVAITIWKPWSEMTAGERRKALGQREGKS
jgi:hypothetical protein